MTDLEAWEAAARALLCVDCRGGVPLDPILWHREERRWHSYEADENNPPGGDWCDADNGTLGRVSAALRAEYEAGELAGAEKERARIMGEIAAIAGARGDSQT